jgi:hypothetical protein
VSLKGDDCFASCIQQSARVLATVTHLTAEPRVSMLLLLEVRKLSYLLRKHMNDDIKESRGTNKYRVSGKYARHNN